MLKLYRTVEAGHDPELEILSFLAERRFANVPRVLGWLDTFHGGRSSATIATVQAFVPHEGDLWQAMQEAVRAFLQDVVSEGAGPAATDDEGDLVSLSRQDPPDVAHRLLGPSLAISRRLGQRVGEMHRLLASADASRSGLRSRADVAVQRPIPLPVHPPARRRGHGAPHGRACDRGTG